MLHIFSDFDGTISDHDTLIFLAENFGGGPQMVEAIGRLIDEGNLTLREGIAAEMRSIRAPFDQAAQMLTERVKLDQGFEAFAVWCEAQKIPLTVLSAGFHQTIELFIPHGRFPAMEIIANQLTPNDRIGWQCEFHDQSDYGHDKSLAIKEAQKRGQHTVFIGDGLSDRPAAEMADEVFAKHSLAQYCRERRIEHHEFHDFNDILKELQTRVI